MSHFRRAVVATIVLLVAAPVFAQEFEAYEGKNSIQQGEGGSKKVVNGVDFWINGAPPHRFKLLGYIHDRRHKTGLVGMVRMKSLEPDVAKKAKEAGGDAVILISSQAETVGFVGQGNASTYGSATSYGNTTNAHANTSASTMSAAVQKQESRFAVVQYLPDADPAAVQASPAAKDDAAKP